jgi:uncharacterized cupredoxin-like copper-binding protein
MANRSKSWRNIPIHFVVAVLAVMAAARAQADITLARLSDPQPVEIKIVSTEFKFMPAKIRVQLGHAVTLVLDNSGAETEHGIVVPAFGLRMEVKAGEIVRRTIVFDTPGEFDFGCDLPGHSEAGMRGKLVVR